MKKQLTAFLLLVGITFGVHANNEAKETHEPTQVLTELLAPQKKQWTKQELVQLKNELDALRNGGWKELSHAERKALKKSLKAARRDVEEVNDFLNNQVTLSVGAIIIIILLLVIIL